MKGSRFMEVKLTIFGRVQGVGFRNMIKNKATILEIAGSAYNNSDGSVNVVAQGKKEDLNELMDWIKTSPGVSSVEFIDEKWTEINKKSEDFKIERETSYIMDKTKSIVNLGKKMIGIGGSKIPQHVVIIPDGNRRWAREKGMEVTAGHYKSGSYDNVKSLIIEAKELGIRYITFWGFSTENWSRDQIEVSAIFELVKNLIEKLSREAKENKIRFRHLGRKDRLPKDLIDSINELEEETKNYHELNVQICLDYGGRDEIIRAVNKMLKSGIKKVDEKEFASYLDSRDMPDPDLIIRTSGEHRLSGMMPFQAVYAELYFADCYFPDFDALELKKAVESYGKRDRRFGGSSK